MTTRIIQSTEQYYPRFLTRDVDFAVRYKQGVVGRKEIAELARSGSFNEAIYTVMSSLNDRPESQRGFLCELTNVITGSDHLTLKEFLVDYIQGMPELLRMCVPQKLCELNAQWDLREWDIHVRELAYDYSPPKRVELSYRCLLGLRHFIAARMHHPAYPLIVPIQEWVEDDGMVYWGHEVYAAPSAVELLAKLWRPVPNLFVLTDAMLD